jgi:hypothetical protein
MLRIISYLAPSIPHGFFEVSAKIISEGTGLEVHSSLFIFEQSLYVNEQSSGDFVSRAPAFPTLKPIRKTK